MKTIFVVDDSGVNLSMAEQALESKYNVVTMLSAARMFAILERVTPDLILLDIEMPEMNGFLVMEKLKERERVAKIPVIFLTASHDNDVETRGIELGAVDFITKPFAPKVLLSRIANHLHISDLIKKRTEQLQNLQNNIVFVLADMVESRDKVTSGHVERTSEYLRILIDAMQERGVYADDIEDWNVDTLVPSARLHDIGKVVISDFILNKPGKLTEEEFEIMKTHTIEGEHIIDRIISRTGDDVFLRQAKLLAGYHHERWDGNGYPYSLKGAEIPLLGRVMALVDVYDALVSERPYKKAYSISEAEKIIQENSGIQFDPKIVDVFFTINEQFREVKQHLYS